MSENSPIWQQNENNDNKTLDEFISDDYMSPNNSSNKKHMIGGLLVLIVIALTVTGFIYWQKRGGLSLISNNDNFDSIEDIYKDTDGDGLSDDIEIAYGTNINKVDTDGDGYSDYDEIESGYNPVGEGKLTENTNLNSYRGINDNKYKITSVNKINKPNGEYKPMMFKNIKNAYSSIELNRIAIKHHVYSENVLGDIIQTEIGTVAEINENGDFGYWSYKPKSEGVMSVSVDCRFDSIPSQTVTVEIDNKFFEIYIPEIKHCSDSRMGMQRKYFVSSSGATFVDKEWETNVRPPGTSPLNQYKEEYLARSSLQRDDSPLRFTEDHCLKIDVGFHDQQDHPVMIKYRRKVTDECYYFIALQNENINYCDKIEDSSDKTKCNNLILSGGARDTEAKYARTIMMPDVETLGIREATALDYCRDYIPEIEQGECQTLRSQSLQKSKQCENNDCRYKNAVSLAGYKECEEYQEDGGCNCTDQALYERMLNRDPKICGLLPKGLRQDECLRDSAAETHNYFLCEHINDKAFYYQCYFEIAKAADLPSYCDHIDDKELSKKCYRKIVGIDLIPKGGLYCDSLGSKATKERCLDVLGELNSYCGGKVLSVNVQSYCLWNMAVVKNDINLCTEIQIQELHNLCEYEICKKTDQDDKKNLNCKNLDTYKEKEITQRCPLFKFNNFGFIDTCFILEARNFADPKICENVTGSLPFPNAKDHCYQNMAVYLNNKSICGEIKDIKIKEICEKYLDERKSMGIDN